MRSDDRWVRHPADLIRFAFATLLAAIQIALVALFPSGNEAISQDLVDLFDYLPRGLTSFLVGLIQLFAIVLPVALIAVLVVRRRFRLLAVLALAALLAAVAVVVIDHFLRTRVPVTVIDRRLADSWLTGAEFPSTAFLAAVAAVAAAAGPWLRHRWRRVVWFGVGVIAVARLLTATEIPLGVGIVLAAGVAAGSLALVIVGAPRRDISDAVVRSALADVGLDVRDLTRVESASPFLPEYDASADSQGPLRIELLGRDERDTYLLLRTWRSLTKKGLGDHRPARSPIRAAEHEALALALAANAGARVPRPVAIGVAPNETALLVQTRVDGNRLSGRAATEVDDAWLEGCWRQVAAIHARRIAHRSLTTDRIVVTDAGPELIGFGMATLEASDEVIAADVANFLVSTALLVGADRAVSAAAAGLGADALGAALPLLQQTVLIPAVRRDVKPHKEILDEVREAAQHASGVEKVELAKLQRVSLGGLVTLIGGVVLGTYLLGLVANWREIWDVLRKVDLESCVVLTVLMIGNYVGGTLSLMGAVVIDLPFLRTLQVMFAQSFLNRFTPANAGGMALRVRYLQLEGSDVTVAAASVGLTSAVNGIVQVVFIIVFFVWGGTTDALGRFSLPSAGKIIAIVLGIVIVAGGILLSSWGRRAARPWIERTWRKIFGTLGELARRPARMALLFGGAALTKLLTIFAFLVSIHALGVDMGLAQAGALYMVANTVGSAVPTPGGVGGIEAALTAVLIGAGVEGATAAAIVLLFRLFTFWLPTLPGYGMLQLSKRQGIV